MTLQQRTGPLLKALRKHLKFTQVDMACVLGISQAHTSKLELSGHAPDLLTFIRARQLSKGTRLKKRFDQVLGD